MPGSNGLGEPSRYSGQNFEVFVDGRHIGRVRLSGTVANLLVVTDDRLAVRVGAAATKSKSSLSTGPEIAARRPGESPVLCPFQGCRETGGVPT
jgi:hypothetical protein